MGPPLNGGAGGNTGHDSEGGGRRRHCRCRRVAVTARPVTLAVAERRGRLLLRRRLHLRVDGSARHWPRPAAAPGVVREEKFLGQGEGRRCDLVDGAVALDQFVLTRHGVVHAEEDVAWKGGREKKRKRERVENEEQESCDHESA